MAEAGGRITTHVLDTSQGVPAEGVRIALHLVQMDGESESRIKVTESLTNGDGRLDAPLLDGGVWSKAFMSFILTSKSTMQLVHQNNRCKHCGRLYPSVLPYPIRKVIITFLY